MDLLTVRPLPGNLAGGDKVGAPFSHQIGGRPNHHDPAVDTRVDRFAVPPTGIGQHRKIVGPQVTGYHFDPELFGPGGGRRRSRLERGGDMKADHLDFLRLQDTDSQKRVEPAGKKNNGFCHTRSFRFGDAEIPFPLLAVGPGGRPSPKLGDRVFGGFLFGGFFGVPPGGLKVSVPDLHLYFKAFVVFRTLFIEHVIDRFGGFRKILREDLQFRLVIVASDRLAAVKSS